MAAFATFKGTERFKKACFRHKEKHLETGNFLLKRIQNRAWFGGIWNHWEYSYDPCPFIIVVSFNKKCKSTHLAEEASDYRLTD